jgi:hypothetical protein
MSIETDVKQLERLRLKLRVNRHLKVWGRQYAGQLRSVILKCDDEELFLSVVDELADDGCLEKLTGERGALILVYRQVGS